MVLDVIRTPGFGTLVFNLPAVQPVWRLCRRVGAYPSIALLVLIPLVGLAVAAAALGLSRWPPWPAESEASLSDKPTFAS